MEGYEVHLKKRAWLIDSEFASNREFVCDHLGGLDELRDCLLLLTSENDAIWYFGLNGLIKIGELDIPDQFDGMVCQYVGDIDGLVCLLFNDVNAAVLNPILHKWNIPSVIPELSVEDVTYSCYGFGKDVDGDYKIVRLRERLQPRKQKAREVAVFSCSSSTWSVKCQMFPNNIRSSCHGQCVEGIIYFLCSIVSNRKEQVSDWEHEKLVISAINLSDLTNTQLELPTKCSDVQASHLYLFPLHDSLGLVEITKEPGCSNRIWSMQQNGDWIVMFALPLNDFGCLKRYLPLRNELIMVEAQVDGSLIVYHLDANNERRLEKKLKVELNDIDGVDTCLASLVSPSQVY